MSSGLDPLRAAVEAQRRLVATRPGEGLPELADRLHELAMGAWELGLHDEGVDPAQEAVAIRRRLARYRPGGNEPALRAGLNNLGVLLERVGRPDEALAAA